MINRLINNYSAKSYNLLANLVLVIVNLADLAEFYMGKMPFLSHLQQLLNMFSPIKVSKVCCLICNLMQMADMGEVKLVCVVEKMYAHFCWSCS